MPILMFSKSLGMSEFGGKEWFQEVNRHEAAQGNGLNVNLITLYLDYNVFKQIQLSLSTQNRHTF